MKQCWKRVAAAAIVLVMMLTMFPVQWAKSAQAAETVTGTVTANDVFLRNQPGSSSYWFKMPMGFTCTVLGQETEKGVVWYKVNSTHPESSTNNTYIGYIHSDYFTVGSSDAGSTAPEEEEETPAAPAVTLVGEVKSQVNFREGATTESNVIQKLPAGTLVQVVEIPGAPAAPGETPVPPGEADPIH